MCFSAGASFTAAVLLTTLGIAAVALIPFKAKNSMTSMERFALGTFADQFSEGFVWLDHDNILAIRVFAYTYAFWPFYFTSSVALVEWTRTRHLPAIEHHIVCSWPRRVFSYEFRRWMLAFNTMLSLVLFCVLGYCMCSAEPLAVKTVEGRLVYKSCTRLSNPEWRETFAHSIHVLTITSSVLLSSIQYSVVVATSFLFSAVTTFILWKNQFESTWCYFSAGISSTILYYISKELRAYPVTPRRSEETSSDHENFSASCAN